jgi:predicted MPP superfamily phosphohydrolase
VKEYTFASPDVPAAFDGTSIVLLTDVHRSFYFTQKRVAGIVDQVNGLEPDLIVLGGDYIYGSEDYFASAFAELGRLEAPLGTFAVLGNHDYAHPGDDVNDPAPAIAAATTAGIQVLRNDGTWIERSGERFWLAGVSDQAQDDPEAGPALAGSGADDLVVMASHEPDFAEELEPDAVDLVLSGHTHGGQMTFFGLWAPFLPSEYGQRYRTGLVVNDVTTVVVSNGVGTIFPPFRFFARPQIVVITLEMAE